MSEFANLHWFVAFNGIADRYLWGFEADGWRLHYGDPAGGMLGIMPGEGASPATLDDARWLADALAFDHDAPVGIWPAADGVWPDAIPRDPAARSVVQPVHPLKGPSTFWYWQSLNQAYAAAAELRFNGSYAIRYDDSPAAPRADFSARFSGKEQLVSLYAMAARQADVMAEYLCLYRVLEAADRRNGKTFARSALASLSARDFGELWSIGDDLDVEAGPNVFEVYRERAERELRRLGDAGESSTADHLYRIRNSLAHGKHDVLTTRHASRFAEAAAALPVVKLLARMAIE